MIYTCCIRGCYTCNFYYKERLILKHYLSKEQRVRLKYGAHKCIISFPIQLTGGGQTLHTCKVVLTVADVIFKRIILAKAFTKNATRRTTQLTAVSAPLRVNLDDC